MPRQIFVNKIFLYNQVNIKEKVSKTMTAICSNAKWLIIFILTCAGFPQRRFFALKDIIKTNI